MTNFGVLIKHIYRAAVWSAGQCKQPRVSSCPTVGRRERGEGGMEGEREEGREVMEGMS